MTSALSPLKRHIIGAISVTQGITAAEFSKGQGDLWPSYALTNVQTALKELKTDGLVSSYYITNGIEMPGEKVGVVLHYRLTDQERIEALLTEDEQIRLESERQRILQKEVADANIGLVREGSISDAEVRYRQKSLRFLQLIFFLISEGPPISPVSLYQILAAEEAPRGTIPPMGLGMERKHHRMIWVLWKAGWITPILKNDGTDSPIWEEWKFTAATLDGRMDLSRIVNEVRDAVLVEQTHRRVQAQKSQLGSSDWWPG